MKNIRKTQLFENENATIRKRNNLKMHLCNPDFFRPFERTSVVVTVSVSKRKITLATFSGGHILRGLITKSWTFTIFNSF